MTTAFVVHVWNRCWLVALVLTSCGTRHTDPMPRDVDTSPVAAADPGSAVPATWREGPFAQIYVRGYSDSDGDGIGDLNGVAQRLDYLQALGVSGIWLMPINASQDHDHGYAVTDHRAVEAQYGTLEDLDALVAQAHTRGIAVILDYVMNHSAAQNPLFVDSYASKTAAHRDWYVWSDTQPKGWSIYGSDPWKRGTHGYYFAGFWDQMPDFNLRTPAVVAYHHDSLRFWLNRGIDGFRFDATANLVENGPGAWENQPEDHALMTDVRGVVAAYQQRWIVCEAPADSRGFTASCGSAFAFGHHSDVIAAVRGDAGALAKVADYFVDAPGTMATMLANHDSFAGRRIWDQLDGDEARYRLAAAIYLLQPGVPFIYYGEEIGLSGGTGTGDPSLRVPMSWSGGKNAGFSDHAPFRGLARNYKTQNVAAQTDDLDSLLAFYRTLIATRRAHPSLARGDYTQAAASGGLLQFARHAPGETSVVAINTGEAAAAASFAGLPASKPAVAAVPIGGAALTTDGAGQLTVDVPARSTAVYLISD